MKSPSESDLTLPTASALKRVRDIEELPDGTLLDEGQTASLLKVRPATLNVWRCTGRHNLPFVKVGRSVRYRLGDVRKWLESRTRGAQGG